MAEGGVDCRYRMHEIGVCRPRRESVHFVTVLEALILGNHSSTRKTVQRGASQHSILAPKTVRAPQQPSTGRVNWMTPELRGWRSGEGGTTVDTGCTRLEYAGQEENQCISLQSSRTSISATAYPFAKPFNGEGATILKLRRKLPNTPAATLNALIGGAPNYGDGGVARSASWSRRSTWRRLECFRSLRKSVL